MAKSLFYNNQEYPIQSWLPQSGLQYDNSSIVFQQPNANSVVPVSPTPERVNQIKGIYNNAFMSNKAKTDLRTQSRIDAGMKEPLKVASNGITLPPTVSKGLSTIDAANIATGISTAVNVGTSIYGAIQASKMKPTLATYQAPIEAVLAKDNTSAIQTAGQENIDKSINTARSQYQRNGIVGMDGILVSKENEGLNQLSASLAQYRQGIDSQNVQIQNQTNQYNQNMVAQKDQFNAQTQNQFDQYKSQLVGMGMKNATDSLQSGTESIFGNVMVGKQNQIASLSSQLSQINNIMSQPNWATSGAYDTIEIQKKKKELEAQLESINKSII